MIIVYWRGYKHLCAGSKKPNTQEENQEAFRILDKLDTERVQYMISAENFAGKPHPNGIYEWSPSLGKREEL